MTILVLYLLAHSSGHHSSHSSHTSHTSHINNVAKRQFVSSVIISSIVLDNINNNNNDELLLIKNFRLDVENNYNLNKFNNKNYSFNILFYNETIKNSIIKKCLFYNISENNNILINFNKYSEKNIYYEFSYCKNYSTALNLPNLILIILVISCCCTMCCCIDDRPRYSMH